MEELGELVDLVAGRAVAEGSAGSSWPGLTYLRFDGPERRHDEVVASLSVCAVAQGRVRVELNDRVFVCGPAEFFVLAQGARFVAEALEACCDVPLLAVILRVDPALTTDLLGQIERHSEGSPPPPSEPGGSPAGEPSCVSPLGDGLAGALLRFVRATDDDLDRRVLAPLALREIIYGVLRSGRWAALAEAAHLESAGDRVAAAITFMRDGLAGPISVEDMADHVSMPVSTFAHLFKATTGSAPYQYLKRLRLDRARALLAEGNRAVGDVCRAVGYGSVSHFISEFGRAYGETPRSYAGRLRRLGAQSSPPAAR